MQNPPAYVQVDAGATRSVPGQSSYPGVYAGMLRDHDMAVFAPHLGHHSGISSSHVQQMPGHLAGVVHGKHSPIMNSPGLMAGVPSGSHQRHFENAHHHANNINEAFVTSFGLTPGAFLNPYNYADRTRSPSPLHRLLHSQLLGGHPSSHGDSHFLSDDFVLESPVFSRSHSSMSGQVDRNHLDPMMIGSSHLSRSLDDLSAVLDSSNDNDSLDLSFQRNSSSPDDSLVSCNELTQSENNSVTSSFAHAAKSSYKQRRNGCGRAEVSRTCPTCGKTFGNSSGLAKHRLTHSDERKYLCTTCMKSFKRQDHLTGHLLTHSDKKPFGCPVENCGKSYCDSRSLKRHLDQHEPWMVPDSVRLMFTDSFPEEVEDSKSVFDASDSQISGVADALKPYACQICRRRFKNGPALNGHMRLHGGFFNKKAEDCTSGPSITSLDSGSRSPDSYSPTFVSKVSPIAFQMPANQSNWNPHPETTLAVENGDCVPSSSLMNHVQVIKHAVASPSTPNSRTPTLPPVSTLASPSNSPTSLQSPFSFYTPPSLSQVASSLASAVANEKIRRHSDSDSCLQPKRLCTVTDMLRRTITLNMERKLQNESPENFPGDGGSNFLNGFIKKEEQPSIPEEHDHFFGGSSELGSSGLSESGSLGLEDRLLMGDDDVMESSSTSDRYLDSPRSSNPSSCPDSTEAPTTPDQASSTKSRKKHRPSPLYIPPQASSDICTMQPVLSPGIGFSSNLRSPRLRDENSASPPPYTPPPMLSPNRSGSGLYWNVLSSGGNTPQSSKFLLRRSLSNSSTSHSDASNTYLGSGKKPMSGSSDFDCTKSPFTFVTPPETDCIPHINVGHGHQADLPSLGGKSDLYHRSKADTDALREDLLWSPRMVSNLTDQEVLSFVSIADTGAVPKGGQNKELAYHLLCITGGDLFRAVKALLKNDYLNAHLPAKTVLREYHYQNSDVWTPEEIMSFSAALLKHDKDFSLVSGFVQTKSVKQCIEFYYFWKKILPDDYKRARAARKRRQQDLIVATRSRATQEESSELKLDLPKIVIETSAQEPVKSFVCPHPSCGLSFTSKQAFSNHSRTHSRSNRVSVNLNTCPPPQPKTSSDYHNRGANGFKENGGKKIQIPSSSENETTAEFPCKICDKVFHGVKSRNAHMKVHRLTEARGPSMVNNTSM